MHQVFVNKKAVQKLWCQCIRPLIARKQFISCGFYASCVCQQRSSYCGVYASSRYQQGSGVIVAMFMHHLIMKEEAVFKDSVSQHVSCNRQKGK